MQALVWRDARLYAHRLQPSNSSSTSWGISRRYDGVLASMPLSLKTTQPVLTRSDNCGLLASNAALRRRPNDHALFVSRLRDPHRVRSDVKSRRNSLGSGKERERAGKAESSIVGTIHMSGAIVWPRVRVRS